MLCLRRHWDSSTSIRLHEISNFCSVMINPLRVSKTIDVRPVLASQQLWGAALVEADNLFSRRLILYTTEHEHMFVWCYLSIRLLFDNWETNARFECVQNLTFQWMQNISCYCDFISHYLRFKWQSSVATTTSGIEDLAFSITVSHLLF